MKIVINTEYGGFGLSEAAQKRYAELSGKTPATWYNIDRADKYLVQVVEELGDEANDLISHLEVIDIEAGTQYRINKYDGLETIEYRRLDDEWKLAKEEQTGLESHIKKTVPKTCPRCGQLSTQAFVDRYPMYNRFNDVVSKFFVCSHCGTEHFERYTLQYDGYEAIALDLPSSIKGR